MTIAIAKCIDTMLMTEKANKLSEENKVLTVYASSCDVTKSQVKLALESAFPKMKVKKIRSIVLHPKTRVFRGKKGVCVKRKKMMITFKDGMSFDVESNKG